MPEQPDHRLLRRVETEFPREATRVSQPAIDAIMATTEPCDGPIRHKRLTVKLKATMRAPSPVTISHHDTVIAYAELYDAIEMEHRVRALRKGVKAPGLVIRDPGDTRWEVRYNTDPLFTAAENPTELASIAASLRSIRWAALVAVWLLIAAVVIGALAGVAAPVGG